MTILKRDELGTADACDRFGARIAPLGEQLTVAVAAVGFVVFTREPLSCQRGTAMGTAEALTVPRLILVGDTARSDHLLAFRASGCEFVLVARATVDVLVLRNERLGADRNLADCAAEAFVVPLFSLVLHLLHSCPKDFITSITSCGERLIIAV